MQPVLTRLKKYKKRIFTGQFFKFIEVVLELIVPLLIAKMVNLGLANQDTGIIVKYASLCLILAFSGMLFAFICQYQASVASQSFGTNLRNDLFAHILTVKEEEISKVGEASLITRMTSDIQVLQQGLAMLVRLVPRTPFICIGSIIMVAFINLRFVPLFILAVLIFSIILFLITKWMLPLIQNLQEHTDKLTGRLLELLTGIRVIRAVVKMQEKEKKYAEHNQTVMKLMQKIGKISSLLNPLTLFALNMISVWLLWLAGGQMQIGTLNSADIIALVNYLTMLLIALIVLANLVLLYTRVYASALRVSAVFELETRQLKAEPKAQHVMVNSPVVDSKQKETLGSPYSIVFDHVKFAYPDRAKLLFDDFSFQLERGKNLGIIGRTGSGKSTLAYLLERRYLVQGGRISILGKDIKEYSEAELLQLLHVIPQSAFLFSGTLRESLAMGKQVQDEEIWEALEIAQAKDFIAKHKKGLEQRVERGGNNFSGGQKQRLCIARALLHHAQIIVFDDAASALDLATDAALQRALRENEKFSQPCFITISQRIATVRRADQILLIDDGQNVGFGTHQELLAGNILYQEIYESQKAFVPEQQNMIGQVIADAE